MAPGAPPPEKNRAHLVEVCFTFCNDFAVCHSRKDLSGQLPHETGVGPTRPRIARRPGLEL
jgi:hypothetical protein